jgi:hypothetical protein
MTPKKRWEWARVFISARQQGLGRLRLAVGIAIWGVLTLSEGPAPRAEMEVEDTEVPEMKRTAPCEDFYEHEGRCYVPIVEKKRAPTSVDE